MKHPAITIAITLALAACPRPKDDSKGPDDGASEPTPKPERPDPGETGGGETGEQAPEPK